MNRGSIRRMKEIDRLIQTGKFVSAQKAADEFGVSRRTIERDLEMLRIDLNADLQYDRTKGRYKYKGSPITLPGMWLSEREIAIMLIAERALRIFTGTSFHEEIHPVFNKFLAPIRHNDKMLESIREICNCVHFHRPFMPVRNVRDEFSVLFEAIVSHRRISMVYHTSGKKIEKRRSIDPYALINNGGDWYMVGRCCITRTEKTFAIGSMFDLKTEDFYFSIPKEFSVEKYHEQSFGRMHGNEPVSVKLRIEAPSAGWVARNIWHPSQTIKKLKENAILLSMKCPITDTLVRWILQLGKDVEVVTPLILRNQVSSTAIEVARKNHTKL